MFINGDIADGPSGFCNWSLTISKIGSLVTASLTISAIFIPPFFNMFTVFILIRHVVWWQLKKYSTNEQLSYIKKSQMFTTSKSEKYSN